MKYITTGILFNELRNYGIFDFSGDCMRYTIAGKWQEHADTVLIKQGTTNLRAFLNNCATCFDFGVNPVFDTLINRI